MNDLKPALEGLLALFPEYGGSLESLCLGAEYFHIRAEDLRHAAITLPLYHDLRYQGVRLLLSACLEEFAAIFEKPSQLICEVTVPAPLCMIYALQDSSRTVRFRSSALFAQIALRGIFLKKDPLEWDRYGVRRCGLNRMRQRLLEHPPTAPPRYQLQFGILCDECAKVSETVHGGPETLTLHLPKTLSPGVPRVRAYADGFLREVCHILNVSVSAESIKRASARYFRLIRAEQALLRLTARRDRLPLWGNSASLAQAVQLMCGNLTEKWITALELLVSELRDAPASQGRRRAYCFFIPFLQPEMERRFRENGVDLLGNAAFLQGDSHFGFNLPDMITAWLGSLGIRESLERQCALTADAMASNSCGFYLTGSFAFDRWLGAGIPMERKSLMDRYGIRSQTLETDFWCEQSGTSPDRRIDEICSLLEDCQNVRTPPAMGPTIG